MGASRLLDKPTLDWCVYIGTRSENDDRALPRHLIMSSEGGRNKRTSLIETQRDDLWRA